ncbi:MAG: GatB/YqeY domain-containing protein [Bacilli bacterium]|nr:GatB/YqeY domain-containing protein [Bacilli bacterium]
MTLYEKISSDMKTFMVNKDKENLSTIRLLKSSIDLARINNKLDEITDDLVIEIASKQIKTHKESIEEFKKAGRDDLVSGLEREINLISNYLPEQLSEEEVRKEIDNIFDIVKPNGKSDMGKIMKEANLKLKGKADFKLVSQIVQDKLSE